MKKAVIIGATGLIGKELLALLLEHDNFEHITVLSRKNLDIVHPKLELRIINFDNNETYLKASDNFTDAFCCLGTTMKQAGSKDAFYKVDFTYCLNFAQANANLNTPHFYIVSALGSDAHSSIYYNQVKGQIETAVSKLPFRSVSIFQPSLLLGNRKEFRLGELIGKAVFKVFGFIFIGKLKKYKAIEGKQVAKAMVKYALQTDKTGVIRIESDMMWDV
jgi:uncharacterized protein YbjT (DUF2867 family)